MSTWYWAVTAKEHLLAAGDGLISTHRVVLRFFAGTEGGMQIKERKGNNVHPKPVSEEPAVHRRGHRPRFRGPFALKVECMRLAAVAVNKAKDDTGRVDIGRQAHQDLEMLLGAEQGRASQRRIVHIVDERRNRLVLWVVERIGVKELLTRDRKFGCHGMPSFRRMT